MLLTNKNAFSDSAGPLIVTTRRFFVLTSSRRVLHARAQLLLRLAGECYDFFWGGGSGGPDASACGMLLKSRSLILRACERTLP